MRSARWVLPALALAAIAVWSIVLYPKLAPAHASPNAQNKCCGGGPTGLGSAVGLRELDFPYFSLRDGFSSTLNLVSDSPKPTDLTIAIYG